MNYLTNGYRLIATTPELEVFTLRIADARPGISEIADWLQTHAAMA